MKSIDKHSLRKVDCESYWMASKYNADSFKPFQLYLHVLMFTTSVMTLRSVAITMLCRFVITIASPQTSFGARLSRIHFSSTRGEMNAWQTNPKGRLRGGFDNDRR